MTVTCTYRQSSGHVTCIDDSTNRVLFSVIGYSGTGEGRDSPQHNGSENVGPTPRGTWEIGAVVPGARTGPISIRIRHVGGETFPATRDRGTFLIHGDNRINDASEGCLILGPVQRQVLVDHGGGTLHVTR